MGSRRHHHGENFRDHSPEKQAVLLSPCSMTKFRTASRPAAFVERGRPFPPYDGLVKSRRTSLDEPLHTGGVIALARNTETDRAAELRREVQTRHLPPTSAGCGFQRRRGRIARALTVEFMSLDRRLFGGGLRTVTAVLLSSSLASAQPPLTVQWVDARLSVTAHDVALAEVLREIAHQTGVEVVGLDRIQESRSIEFADKRLADGLKLLLEDLDYVMAIRDPLALMTTPPAMRVWVYLKSPPVDVPAQPGDPDAPTPAEPTPGGADGTWPEAVTPAPASTDQEIPAADIDPELRSLEDSRFFDQASESSILQATNAESPAVRARALKVLGARDSSVSADAFGIAMVDSDPAVSSVASALMADSNAPNVLENLGSVLRHSDPVVRFTALELLTRRADPESLPYLSPVLNDENEVIRTTAQRLVKQLSLLEPKSRER